MCNFCEIVVSMQLEFRCRWKTCAFLQGILYIQDKLNLARFKLDLIDLEKINITLFVFFIKTID